MIGATNPPTHPREPPHHITNHPNTHATPPFKNMHPTSQTTHTQKKNNSYLAHVQQNVPENKVSVAPYIEREVKPLMRGEDLIVTSAEEEEEEEGK